jgi:hypothetical protein
MILETLERKKHGGLWSDTRKEGFVLSWKGRTSKAESVGHSDHVNRLGVDFEGCDSIFNLCIWILLTEEGRLTSRGRICD